MTLARQFLRLQRVSLIVWIAVVVLMTAAITGAAPSITQNNALEDLMKTLPPALQQLVGAGIPNPVDSFIAMKLLLTIPALGAAFAVMMAAAMIARERDRGTVDFLLALPLDRRQVLFGRFAAVVIGLVLLYASVWLTLVIGLKASGAEGSYGRYALALLAGCALNIGQAGVALALSLRLREYGRTVRYALGLVLVPWLLEMVLKAADMLPNLRYLLLYRLADAIEIIRTGNLPWGALGAGVLLAAVCLVWSAAAFDRIELQG